eukprot:m.80030 g.80030  ORF g.80030 m.80030 type:complete len:999 (-) comp8616_c10_seq6:2862-5858(-)
MKFPLVLILLLLLSSTVVVEKCVAQTRVVRIGYMAIRSFFGAFVSGGFEAELVLRAAFEYYMTQDSSVSFEIVYGESSPTNLVGAEERCDTVAKDLVAEDVDVVIGPPSSGCSQPSNAYFSSQGVPQISHSATSQALSNKAIYPTFFRVPPSDANQGRILVQLATLCPEWKSIGIILSIDTYSTGLRDIIINEMGNLNITLDQLVEFPPGLGLENITGIFADFKETTQTSVNIILGLRNEALYMLKAAELNGMVGGGWTWLATDGTVEAGGVIVNGLIGLRPISISGDLSEDFNTFPDQYRYSQYAADVGVPGFANRLFDAVGGVYHAVKNAPIWPTTVEGRRSSVLRELRKFNSSTTGYDGASSSIIFFDENQDGPASYEIVNIVDGTYVVIGTATPTDGIVFTKEIMWADDTTGFNSCPSAEVQRAVSSKLDKRVVVTVVVLCVVVVILIAVSAWLYYNNNEKNKPIDFAPVLGKIGLEASNLSVPLELSRKSIKLGDKIGEGHYGIVYKGTFSDGKAEKRDVAIKTLFDDYTAADVWTFKQEAVIMTQFTKHPNVIKLFGVVSVGRPLFLVMELCSNGSLDKYLARCFQRIQVSVLGKLKMGLDVIEGMCHIVSKGAIHRDLACRNILVAEDFTCKVADFGLSRNDTYYNSKAKNFPIKWTAPEAYNDSLFSEKSDVWSFGILMCEIFLNGNQPYPGYSHEQVRIGVFADKMRHDQVTGMPNSVYEILMQCWNEDPRERPTFEELKRIFEELMDYIQSMSEVAFSTSSVHKLSDDERERFEEITSSTDEVSSIQATTTSSDIALLFNNHDSSRQRKGRKNKDNAVIDFSMEPINEDEGERLRRESSDKAQLRIPRLSQQSEESQHSRMSMLEQFLQEGQRKQLQSSENEFESESGLNKTKDVSQTDSKAVIGHTTFTTSGNIEVGHSTIDANANVDDADNTQTQTQTQTSDDTTVVFDGSIDPKSNNANENIILDSIGLKIPKTHSSVRIHQSVI